MELLGTEWGYDVFEKLEAQKESQRYVDVSWTLDVLEGNFNNSVIDRYHLALVSRHSVWLGHLGCTRGRVRLHKKGKLPIHISHRYCLLGLHRIHQDPLPHRLHQMVLKQPCPAVPQTQTDETRPECMDPVLQLMMCALGKRRHLTEADTECPTKVRQRS